METRKQVTFLAVSFILALTALVLAIIVTKKEPVRNPAKIQKGQPVSQTKPLPGQPAVQNDSDLQALESDLNSINDEEFGESSLSDQAVGL